VRRRQEEGRSSTLCIAILLLCGFIAFESQVVFGPQSPQGFAKGLTLVPVFTEWK